uniref:Cytochrome c oxidase subunit 5A, mitochondrial n=1 Tax=Anguilla anguilla TaxID=7936 RepID=A0A0E9VKK3_ANGAN
MVTYANRVSLVYEAPLASRCYSHGKQETDEEFDARWVTYFNKPDIDAWELRKA